MAIAHSEYAYLHERARNARSREEHDYYLRGLRELEMKEEMHRSKMMYEVQSPIFPLGDKPKPVKEEITPLSFLKSADKKLLLTGATT